MDALPRRPQRGIRQTAQNWTELRSQCQIPATSSFRRQAEGRAAWLFCSQHAAWTALHATEMALDPTGLRVWRCRLGGLMGAAGQQRGDDEYGGFHFAIAPIFLPHATQSDTMHFWACARGISPLHTMRCSAVSTASFTLAPYSPAYGSAQRFLSRLFVPPISSDKKWSTASWLCWCWWFCSSKITSYSK